jgi:hypothetical protein
MGASAALLLPYALKDRPEDHAFVAHNLNGLILDSAFTRISPLHMPVVQHRVQEIARYADELGIKPEWFNNAMAWLNQAIIAPVEAQLALPLSQISLAQQYADHPISTTLPILLMHGTVDLLTPFAQMLELWSVLHQRGLPVTAYPLRLADHLDTNWKPMGQGYTFQSTVRGEKGGMMKRINTFMESVTAESPVLSEASPAVCPVGKICDYPESPPHTPAQSGR